MHKKNGTTILTSASPAHKKHGYGTGKHKHKKYEEEMISKGKYTKMGVSKKYA